ncbi:MAG: TetR/AcrR family transcriptional regulator [Erysipelotrichales bacterium]|nr:TetR/AcrR family transcriptional regulator [Erysipelotrichales bacterium]
MQILKPEVKARIIDAALLEFSDNGFKDASLRKIALNAKITVGNIYAYFRNKESLFEAVLAPIVDDISWMVRDLLSQKSNSTEYIKFISSTLATSFKKSKREYVILLSIADNKKYTIYREQIIKLIDDSLRDEKVIEDSRLRSIIARSLFEGLVMILKESDDLSEQELQKLLFDYLCYTFNID